MNISRIKNKPKERVMKIYATQKDKESDVQKMKEREEREIKERPGQLNSIKPVLSKETKEGEPAKIESADCAMETLF